MQQAVQQPMQQPMQQQPERLDVTSLICRIRHLILKVDGSLWDISVSVYDLHITPALNRSHKK